MPPEVVAMNAIDFDYDYGAGIEYEPYEQFLSDAETVSWFQEWTGNPEVTGAEFRIFGQDGSGGCVGFWLARPEARLLEQPVVFLGSEGETAVLARDFADYLWLLVGGYGPNEALEFAPTGSESRRETPGLEALAEKFASGARKAPSAVLAIAKQEFPDFEGWIESLIRY